MEETKYNMKRVKNWIVTQEIRSLSATTKYSTILVEVHRRLRNTLIELKDEIKAHLLMAKGRY